MRLSTTFNPGAHDREVASTGIGYATAKQLARKGAKVYIGSRSEEKGENAVTKLKEEGIGSGEVVYLHVDLSTPQLAKKSAEKFIELEDRLDVLGATIISLQ